MRCRDGDGRLLRHGGKGQDQAALLAEKRKDRLLQVFAKKKERSPGRLGIRERSFSFLKTAHGRQSIMAEAPHLAEKLKGMGFKVKLLCRP